MPTRTGQLTPPPSLRAALLDVVRFPLWWYTDGLLVFGAVIFAPLNFAASYLALPTLAENLTQPLYGDVSWTGRMVSVLVRVGHFLVLLGAVGVLGALLALAYVLWVLVPLVAVFEIFRIGVGLFLP